METINALSALVGNIGLPSVIVIGAGIFIYKRAWPDLMHLGELYATALIKLAGALEKVADKLPDPPARTIK